MLVHRITAGGENSMLFLPILIQKKTNWILNANELHIFCVDPMGLFPIDLNLSNLEEV